MYPRAMILVAVIGVSLSLLLGFFSMIALEVVAILVTVSIGIPALITQAKVKPKEEEKGRKQEANIEEKEILREEIIRVSPRDAFYYELELERGDNLKGEISSDSHIDVYFVNKTNFKKWDKDRTFNYEYCHESVLKTKIDYEVPKRGIWYLLIENNGSKTAIVETCVYLSS